MREIKFRAWDKEKNVMRVVKCLDFSTASIETKPIDGTSEMWEVYDHICFKGSYELMQCTGLKDKNGAEIYEGDIVLIDDDGDSYMTTIVWGGEDNYPAFDLDFRYIPDEWRYDSNALSSIMNNDYETIEVIGNIYENPELLEVSK